MRLPPLNLLPGLLLAILPAGAAERPNILWLTSEDHGPEMGCYGDPVARTPQVDALAAQGMIFTRVWSVAPVCAPARTAIITGMYPSSTGGLHMRSLVPLPPEIRLFPEYLREAGYYCTNNQKEDYNVAQRPGLWAESSRNAHWQKRAPGQPFFAVFNSTKSHESQIRTRPHVAITDPAKVRVPSYHPDLPEVRQDWAQYYDKVSEADADAGERLRELAEAGLAEDTIVFYYGDHGSGMPRSKRWPSNSGLHVPLVVYFPEKWRHLAPAEYQPGGRSDRLVSFVDLAPTVLSLAGVEPPSWMQGHAFAGQYQVQAPALLFGERGRMDERMDQVRSVTDGRHVYLRNYHPHVSQAQRVNYQFQTPTTRLWRERFDRGEVTPAQAIFWRVPKEPEELYDLAEDPDEVRNLASSPAHAAVKDRLARALREHLLAVRDVTFLPEIEMHARAAGSSPYAVGHDESRYPLAAILQVAEDASSLDPSVNLVPGLQAGDSAIRAWSALGLVMRGPEAVKAAAGPLREKLADRHPEVRIAAAEALGRHGSPADAAAARATLQELASPATNGVLVAMSALVALEAMGPADADLRAFLLSLPVNGPMPAERFDGYVARLVESLTSSESR